MLKFHSAAQNMLPVLQTWYARFCSRQYDEQPHVEAVDAMHTSIIVCRSSLQTANQKPERGMFLKFYTLNPSLDNSIPSFPDTDEST